MIKVLSIGNSFSQDAQRYLHKIAKNEGVEMKCMNLYIGGCSLRRHYVNMLEDREAYEMEFNGQSTGISVSIARALASDEWDYVTLQQVSTYSMDYESYKPYIDELADYVRMYVPKAKILLHQTWAYEQDSYRLNTELGFKDQHEMLEGIVEAYKKIKEDINADGIIPCGEAMMKTIDSNAGRMHSDTTHADRGVGRYLLALTWYMALTGQKAQNKFADFDVEVDDSRVETVKKSAEFIFDISRGNIA